MSARCPTCESQLAYDGHCELCTCRRHGERVMENRDKWFSLATQYRESAEKRKAWAQKMEAQLRANGIEPVASDDVA